jgi:hypothetical protein
LYLDIQDYGWVGDGSSQHVAWNAVMAAASALGGGQKARVILPAFNIKLEGNAYLIPDNVVVEGSEGTLISVHSGSTATSMTFLVLGSGSVLRNVIVDGNKVSATSGILSGITSGSGKSDWLVDNVLVRNFSGTGATFVGNSGKVRALRVRNSGVVGVNISGTSIQAIGIESTGNATYGIRISDGSVDIQLIAPISNSNGGDGIIVIGRTCSGIDIVAPKCKSNAVHGIALVTVDNVGLTAPVCELNGVDGVSIFGARYCTITAPQCKNNSQSANNAGNEMSILSDGTTAPVGNSIVNPVMRITGVIKSGYSILENGGAPHIILGGSLDAGNFGQLFLGNPLSRNIGVTNLRDSEDPQTVITNAAYSATIDDYYIRYTTGVGDQVLNIPDPTGTRRSLIVMKVDAAGGRVVISSLGAGKTINGASSYNLTTQYQSVLLVSNGTQWEAM